MSHAGAETVHEIVVKAIQWLESMEEHLRAQLVWSLRSYYLFLQTREEVDWGQPLVTVFQGLGYSRIWEAAQTCSCLDAVLQDMSSDMVQYAGVQLIRSRVQFYVILAVTIRSTVCPSLPNLNLETSKPFLSG